MSAVRSFIVLYLACAALLCNAQPDPPTFCFVLAGPGNAVRPLKRDVVIVQRYTERIPYVGMRGSWLKSETEHSLQPDPLFQRKNKGWLVYGPVEAMANPYVRAVAGLDTMRMDLPEDPQELIDRAWRRSTRETPEVIRFRKGRYTVAELIAGPWAEAAAQDLAERLIAGDDAAYKQQPADQEEYYRNLPPPEPPRAPHIAPPLMTEEQWAAELAKRPGLRKVDLVRVSADTVHLLITGRVVLDGGCGSGMPLFGVEMLTDTGWAERIPFDLTQMDCGMPWANWEDHVVMMPPLRWWVAAHQPEGKKELVSGSYRLRFEGANMKALWTRPFVLDP